MSNSGTINTSGDGTRPTTSGGVDNIGGADGFIPGKAKPANSGVPAPQEKMGENRQDHAAPQTNRTAPPDLN